MRYCVICGTSLLGKQRKYCSHRCSMKAFNATPERKVWLKEWGYTRNKYIKKPEDKLDQRGEKNPNWKGGISKDNMRYRKKFVKENREKVKVQGRTRRAIKSGGSIPLLRISLVPGRGWLGGNNTAQRNIYRTGIKKVFIGVTSNMDTGWAWESGNSSPLFLCPLMP